MLRDTAIARLKLEAQANIEPRLTDAECQTILDMYAVMDSAGLPPTDAAWVGTWNLNAACRKAWQVKAAKVVPDIDYDVDGARYSQDQLIQHCLSMANLYHATGVASLAVE